MVTLRYRDVVPLCIGFDSVQNRVYAQEVVRFDEQTNMPTIVLSVSMENKSKKWYEYNVVLKFTT